MFNKDKDVFAEVFLACEDHKPSDLRTINEEMRDSMSSSVASAILGRARGVFNNGKFGRIERTDGRWSNYTEAKSVEQCLAYLRSYIVNASRTSNVSEQREYLQLVSFVNALSTIREFLAQNESRFNEHYSDEMVKYTYMTLATTLEHGVNSLILQLVQYIKGDYGSFTVSVRRVDLRGDVVLSTAMSLASHISSGKMATMFTTMNVQTESNISDRFEGIMTKATGAYDSLKTLAKNPVLRGLAYSAGFFAILIHIRDILFYLLRASNSFSQWAEARALFLEMNARNISGSNPVSAEKQRAVAEKFRALADKFNLENRANNAEVVR